MAFNYFWNKYPMTNFHELNLSWVLDKICELDMEVTEFIKNWQSPTLAYNSGDFKNKKLVYLYVGNEVGWSYGHWYYYNTSVNGWVDGGDYGNAVSDDELNSNSVNPVQNKTLSSLIDFVTPQYYGAKGTGIDDDTEAIQTAMDSGKIVYFPKANYLVHGKILVPAGSVLIGNDAVIKWTNNVDDTFLFGNFGIQNIHIEGITFDFDGQTDLKYGMSFTTCENISIKNCEFVNSYGYALRLTETHDFRIEDCTFHAIDGGTGNPGGAIFGIDSYDGIVKGCECFDIDDHFAYFAGASSTYNIVIENNNIYSSGFGGYTSGGAIVLYANAYGITVAKNSIKNCRSGIQVSYYGSYTTVPHDITVVDCVIDTVTENGITAHGLSSAHLNNCVFQNISMKAVGQDAVSMRYADYCTLSKVDANTITRYGIELSYTNYCHVSGCNIRNCAQIAVIAGNTGDCNNTMFEAVNCVNTSAGQTGLYIRRGNNNKVFGYYATGFNANYSNAATNTMVVNDSASNGKFVDVSSVSSLSGTSISWNPSSDGWVSMSENPSDNNMRYIVVTDTTSGHVVATCYSSGGIRASVNFPYVNGHAYTITRNEATNSLQVQTFRLA